MKVPFPPPLYLLRRFPRENALPVTVVRRYYTGEVWRERSPSARLALLAALGCWPIVNAWTILRHTRRNGSAAQARGGRSMMMQVCDQFRLGARYGLSPREYYGFELFRDDKRRLAAAYLNRYETGGELIRWVQKQSGRAAPAPMTDKERFAADCRAANLAVVPIVLVAVDGALRPPAGSQLGSTPDASLPECDLFLKPLGSSIRSTDSGQTLSAARWDYLGDGRYRGQGGEVLGGDELMQRIRQLSTGTSYLIQPRLRNHPEIADLSNGALSSVTIQTFLDEHGRPEVVAAYFHSAAGKNTLADNASLGGLIAAVDIGRGTLGPATDSGKKSDFSWHDTHPDTGARLTGRTLPIWQDALDLARRAHAAFSDDLVVGWDMALTASGPLLIEGDPRGYVTLKQRAYGTPFGTMRYRGALRASHHAPGPGCLDGKDLTIGPIGPIGPMRRGRSRALQSESLDCAHALQKGVALFAMTNQTKTYDAIIVGAGVSGSFIANTLTQAGLRCLVLEAGKDFNRHTYPRNEVDANSQLYWGAGIELDKDARIGFLRPKAVGGGSIVNQALVDRFDASAFDSWREASGVGFFNRADLDPFYDRVASAISIQRVPEEYRNGNAEVFQRGFAANGYRCAPLERAQSNCRYEDGNCCIECLAGCRIDSKQSMAITVLRRARDAGCALVAEFEVRRVTASADGVSVSGTAADGAATTYQAKYLVMGAGAIGNSRLLLASGFATRLPALGYNFYTHPQYMNLGVYDHPINAHRGPLQSYKSDDPNFRRSGFKLENVFAPPVAIAMLVPGFGRAHQRHMRAITHFACIEVAVRDTNPGRIRVGRGDAAIIEKRLNAEDERRRDRGLQAIRNIFLSTGAKDIIEGDIAIGLHLMGGCNMGTDPQRSVTSPEFRLHGFRNVYAADSSIFPNAPGINPSFTIMALSLKAGDHMLAEMRA